MAKLGSRASFSGTVVENITAAKTLDPSDSGKVFTLDQDASFDITLPTAAQAGVGWNARFILTDAGSGTVKVIPNSAEDTLIGMIESIDTSAGASAESGVDELIWVASTAAVGDWAELVCDGSNFYVSGQMHDNDHITLA
jgi:hypothetical protein|tara:strand:- start:394 stop:813 length:420 start_codon:yes stop_codon:yes gene_type:complete